MEFSIRVWTHPASTKKKHGLKWMNFKVNLFFTFMRPPSPSWYPHPDSPEFEWWGRLVGGHNGKEQVCFKMLFRLFSLMENSFNFFFWNRPLVVSVGLKMLLGWFKCLQCCHGGVICGYWKNSNCLYQINWYIPCNSDLLGLQKSASLICTSQLRIPCPHHLKKYKISKEYKDLAPFI